MKIKISFASYTLKADVFDTPTGNAIYESLPFSGKAQVWGKEAYFTIPINQPLESDAQEEVTIGGLAYWPDGQCFCIFWGQTPISAVNVFGQIIGNIEVLSELQQGETVRIEI